MNGNPLNDLLSPTIRKYLYAAYVLAGFVVGALAVAGVDVGKAPDVLAYLAIPFGALAASNVTPTPGPEHDDGLDYAEAGGGEYPEDDVDPEDQPITGRLTVEDIPSRRVPPVDPNQPQP